MGSNPEIRQLVGDLIRPGCFLAAFDVELSGEYIENEDVAWEVFQGRLLDSAHTRQRRTFESWNVHLVTDAGLSPEPLVSLKRDTEANVIHVVRGVDGYAWRGRDEGNVLVEQEVRLWTRELVATVELAQFAEAGELRAELAAALGRAITGVRLPLMPVEAPHPLFSFGKLFFADTPSEDAIGDTRDALALLPTHEHPHRVLECWLRAVPLGDLEEEQRSLTLPGDQLLILLRRMFLEVSLSPYTDFIEKVLRLLAMRDLRPDEVVDFESWLLRLVCRHLTAYDLLTFHHRGANYPDALLLDAVLRDLLAQLEAQPALFAGETGRLRRRALRQAWVVRRQNEGLPVPDAPTSPGEHMRAFPVEVVRVPEEQILQAARRQRCLYAGDSLVLSEPARAVLRQAVEDLDTEAERLELGAAVYLDRPFGGAKEPVAPDGTPLLASLAFSRRIALERWRLLVQEVGGEVQEEQLALPGLPLEAIGPAVRAGSLSLTDAALVSMDFVFRQTLPGSVRLLLERIDFGSHPTDWLRQGPALVARSRSHGGLTVYDAQWQARLELRPRLARGYASRRGVEWPVDGVEVSG